MLKAFRVPLGITIAALAAVGAWRPGLVVVVLVLAVLEVSFSFDNAVINAKVLVRMSPFWQRMFLTVGVLIAVFGMRLVFPLAIVSIGGHLTPVHAVDLALNHADEYQRIIESKRAAIQTFGGVFLLMIFLDWVLGDKDINWLVPLERAAERVGHLSRVAIVILSAVLLVTSIGGPTHSQTSILFSGLAGLIAYLAVSATSDAFEEPDDDNVPDEQLAGGAARRVASAGIGLFLYLEMVDASFSFDGVIGAFAVTDNPIAIAVGLGVGAIYVRRLTIVMVQRGVLEAYPHLDHGAHWAIGVLAVISLVAATGTAVNEYVTGLVGVAFIGAAVLTSISQRRHADADPEEAAAERERSPASVR